VLKLYDSQDSGNAYKVRLVLAHLDQDYERVELDTDSGETRTPEFLAKNPNGKVPALELDSGEVLCESNAIMFYLANGTSLLPDDDLACARVLQWMFFEQYSHEPYIAVSRHILKHVAPNDTNRAMVVSKHEPGHRALKVMDDHLAKRRYFVDEHFTIADVALYAYTHVAGEGGFDLEQYPAIGGWLERVREQPQHIPITLV